MHCDRKKLKYKIRAYEVMCDVMGSIYDNSDHLGYHVILSSKQHERGPSNEFLFQS